MQHKNDLFVKDGQALRFYIRPCPEKGTLRPLIEHGGGELVAKLQAGVIYLIPPWSKVVDINKDALHSRYIIACVETNQLLPFEDFKAYLKSGAVGGLAPRVEEEPMEISVVTRQDIKERREYRVEEDLLIMELIEQNDWYDKIKGQYIWKIMELTIKDRTWQSLKHRFNKIILNFIDNYNIPESQKSKLMKAAGIECLGTEDEPQVVVSSEEEIPPVSTVPVERGKIIHLAMIQYLKDKNLINCRDLYLDKTWEGLRTIGVLSKYKVDELKFLFGSEVLPAMIEGVYSVRLRSGDVASLIQYREELRVNPLGNCEVPYTDSEDYAILAFITERNCFDDLKSIAVWQEMTRIKALKSRSAQSLQDHFEIVLRPIIEEDQRNGRQRNTQTREISREKISSELEKSLAALSTKEDHLILGFIVKNNCYSDLDDDEIWIEMNKVEDLQDFARTQLRKRFELAILPNLENYAISFSRKEMKSLMEYRFSRGILATSCQPAVQQQEIVKLVEGTSDPTITQGLEVMEIKVEPVWTKSIYPVALHETAGGSPIKASSSSSEDQSLDSLDRQIVCRAPKPRAGVQTRASAAPKSRTTGERFHSSNDDNYSDEYMLSDSSTEFVAPIVSTRASTKRKPQPASKKRKTIPAPKKGRPANKFASGSMSHVSMIESLKDDVMAIDSVLESWTPGGNNEVIVPSAQLLDVGRRLKDMASLLRNLELSCRVEVILKKPLLNITPEDKDYLVQYDKTFNAN